LGGIDRSSLLGYGKRPWSVVVGDFSGEGPGLLLAGDPAIVKRKL
jgi:hypothetical protein